MPKHLKEAKIKNKVELEKYLLNLLKSKKVDTSDSDLVEIVTNYLKDLNNFYEEKENEQKPIEDFLLKVLFENKYMNYQKENSEFILNYHKNKKNEDNSSTDIRKVLFNQYINYKKIFSKYEISFIKTIIELTNIVKYKNSDNKNAFAFMAKIINDFEIVKMTIHDLIFPLSEETKLLINAINEITIKLIDNGTDNNNLTLVESNIKLLLESQLNKNINEVNEKSVQQINSLDLQNQPSTSEYKPNLPKI